MSSNHQNTYNNNNKRIGYPFMVHPQPYHMYMQGGYPYPFVQQPNRNMDKPSQNTSHRKAEEKKSSPLLNLDLSEIENAKKGETVDEHVRDEHVQEEKPEEKKVKKSSLITFDLSEIEKAKKGETVDEHVRDEHVQEEIVPEEIVPEEKVPEEKPITKEKKASLIKLDLGEIEKAKKGETVDEHVPEEKSIAKQDTEKAEIQPQDEDKGTEKEDLKKVEEEEKKGAKEQDKENEQKEEEEEEDKSDNEPSFTIQYDSGVWSPDTPDLPKIYSKEFLLQFKDHCKTLTEEEKKSINFIPTKPTRQYTKHKHNKRSGSKSRKQQRQRPNKMANVSDLEKKRMEIKRLLNSITTENAPDLAERLIKITRVRKENIEVMIDVLYAKAISEMTFVELYADLCRFFSYQERQEKKVKKSIFKQLIIQRCQREFELKKKPQDIPEGLSREEEIDLEIRNNKIREKNDGNAVFVGELYKRKLLSTKIMHFCISTLLPSSPKEEPDDFDLENFLKLMKTIGKKLDEKDKAKMDTYFNIVKELKKDKRVATRIRFRLMDLLDERSNDWVPRKDRKK